MPSSFAGSKAVRSVFVSSVALAPRDTNVPLAGPNKRAHEAVVASPESRKVAKTITATTQDHKLELCAECLVRRGIKKVCGVPGWREFFLSRWPTKRQERCCVPVP